MNVARVVVSDNEAGIENNHCWMKLCAINDGIDLLAQPFVAVGVFLRLEVLKAAALGVRLGAGKVCLDGFVEHLANGFAGKRRLGLQGAIHFFIDIPNGCIHSVFCNTSTLTVQSVYKFKLKD